MSVFDLVKSYKDTKQNYLPSISGNIGGGNSGRDVMPLFDTNDNYINSIIFNDADSNIRKSEQYNENIWVYICVREIAQAVASIPFKFYKDIDGVTTAINRHPVIDLLKKVNNWSTSWQLKYATIAFLLLEGNAYWYLIGKNPDQPISKRNLPTEIWVINPKRISVVSDQKDFIKNYVYEVGSRFYPIDKSRIIHFKDFNPLNDFYGLGNISPLAPTIKNEKEAMQFNASFYENSSVPSGVLKTDQKLQNTIRDRLMAEWRNLYGGSRKAHKTAILEAGLDYKSIAVNQKDADFINSRHMNREEILAGFGVPPIIVGLDTNNYATAKEQTVGYYSRAVIPNGTKLINAIQEYLLPIYGDDTLCIDLNLTKTPFFEALQESKEDRARKNIQSGLMSMNEARINILNLKSIGKDGDVLYMPANIIPVANVNLNPLVDAGIPPEANTSSPNNLDTYNNNNNSNLIEPDAIPNNLGTYDNNNSNLMR